MKYSYKLHGKPKISGEMAEAIYNELAHFGFLPGRFTCAWRENIKTGWIEVRPEKISVLFTLEAESAGEFFGVLSLYKKYVETKNGMNTRSHRPSLKRYTEKCLSSADSRQKNKLNPKKTPQKRGNNHTNRSPYHGYY